MIARAAHLTFSLLSVTAAVWFAVALLERLPA